ncbi:MAG: tetratricopeptide repeat protein [Sandaracinaceae bacterium]|nr:tetratricopeptide repeat protein [Sandaracinaceae bacterium]
MRTLRYALILSCIAALSGASFASAQDGGSFDGGSLDGGVAASDGAMAPVVMDGGVAASDGAPAADQDGAPVQNGTVQNGTVAPGASPWAGATDVSDGGEVPLPTFLVTTDHRMVDDRPPPTAEQVTALREMEAEVANFTRAATSYRDTVSAIVRREYLRQRRTRDEGYSRQVREEERLQNEARDRAIRLFEQFVEHYPNDPTYTPDAMFRLGELYYERSATTFQEQIETTNAERDRRQADGLSSDDIPEVEKDFGPTINLYRRLVQSFPTYRRIDGVLYLIGYCLNEMGNIEEARLAWLNLACANHFTYNPSTSAPIGTAVGPEEPDAGTDEHPSLTMDPIELTPPPSEIYTDPYEGCTPVSAETQFVAEVWLRIGEYHFDNDYSDDGHGLDRAISAYSKILAMPEDRNYNLALYKLAWSYYRASRYPEALRYFAQLVQWSDDEQARTGRAGTELRSEAIQYLAITFAYDDWNENTTPDVQEGQPTGFLRIQDQNLLPQDRPWTLEVFQGLGNVYFEEAKYPLAIEVWRYILAHWPTTEHAPEITNMIARAYTRNNDQEHALSTRAELANFGIGTPWYNANNEHPAEQRMGEDLAEHALIDAATQFHARAQQMRQRGVMERDLNVVRQAQEQYRLAAQAYRDYIQRYPNNPDSYELNYQLADALYWSEDYEGAAREYAQVRDSNLDDAHLSEAARRVVESLKRLEDAAVANHTLERRTEPPESTDGRIGPVQMPEIVQRLAQAREIYLARVDQRHDAEHVRDAYDYNNTLLLYMYGYWPQATERFTRIYDEHCSGANANETGQVAFLNLRNMAVALNQPEEVARLAADLQRRQCTFSADATPGSTRVDCANPENRDNPFCIATGDLNNEQYRLAINVFTRAEGATGDEQVRLYEDAASRFLRAVDAAPQDRQAPIALERAAVALQRVNRFDSASRIYQRIIDEVGPRTSEDATEQASLDNILSNAYFQLAYSANHNFDYDRAIQNYRVLADSARFARSTEARFVQRREDAIVNVATILEYQQQYAQAAEYYRRLVAMTHDDATRMTAAYRIAEMSYKQRSWTTTIRDMQQFVERYRTQANSGELVMQALWRVVQARRAHNEPDAAIRQSLQIVVDTFGRSGQAAGSFSAEYAAQAKFELVDVGIGAFENFHIDPGTPATMAAYVSTLETQIVAGLTQTQQLAAGYAPLPEYRRPIWTVAAFVRQGRIYEILSRAILNTPFTVPRDMAAQMRPLPQEARELIQQQVTDRVQQVLDSKVRPIECLAVQRYALAARAARIGNLDNEFTRIAIDRLTAYGEERVVECVAAANAADPSFAASTPGEFARSSRGQNLDIRPDVSPPTLAPEDQ